MNTPEEQNNLQSTVAIVSCESYSQECVDFAVTEGIRLLGGASRFCSAGEKLLFKLNMLNNSHPDCCVVTHPALFEALIKVFKPTGARLQYGDSPAIHKPATAAETVGYASIARAYDVELANFVNSREIAFPEASVFSSFPLVNGVLDADNLISVSKLKTHSLTRLTGAVKNLFGCIPGLSKAMFHRRLPVVSEFSRFLVDLHLFLKPKLHVMDAIFAMEGNGPASGTPKKLGILLFSTDPVALDTVASIIIDLRPDFVITNRVGHHARLGTMDINRITILGKPIKSCIDHSFDVVRKPQFFIQNMGPLQFLLAPFLPKPVIEKELCTRCGHCVNICPASPKALSFKLKDASNKNYPLFFYKHCIRCFCCQETCPAKAIRIKYPKTYICLSGIGNILILIKGARYLLRKTAKKIWK